MLYFFVWGGRGSGFFCFVFRLGGGEWGICFGCSFGGVGDFFVCLFGEWGNGRVPFAWAAVETHVN